MESIYKVIIITTVLHCMALTEFIPSTAQFQRRYLSQDSPLQHVAISPDTIYYNEPNQPEYRFSYDVTSMDTGDIKSQYENRDGDSVTGFYSLMDPDGTLREVHYTADGYHGFRATVKRYRNGVQIE